MALNDSKSVAGVSVKTDYIRFFFPLIIFKTTRKNPRVNQRLLLVLFAEITMLNLVKNAFMC